MYFAKSCKYSRSHFEQKINRVDFLTNHFNVMILSKFWKETIRNVCNPFPFFTRKSFTSYKIYSIHEKKAFIYHYG